MSYQVGIGTNAVTMTDASGGQISTGSGTLLITGDTTSSGNAKASMG